VSHRSREAHFWRAARAATGPVGLHDSSSAAVLNRMLDSFWVEGGRDNWAH
jgi:hypothetical protein